MIDIILLRIIKNRKDYAILKPLIQPAAMQAKTVALLEDFDKYFEGFPSHESIDITTFMTRFPQWHKGITEEQVREYARIMQNVLSAEADDDQRAYIMTWLADEDMSVRMSNLIAQYNEGEIENLAGEIDKLNDGYRRARGLKQIKYIDESIRDLLKDDTNMSGLHWRLSCLNRSMRPLRPGDFGLIAARPDQGKTSMLASELSFMAPQLPDDKNVVWLNNEGPGRRIIPRIWQAALNLTISEMVELDRADKLEEMYLKVMGRFDKIRVIDIHGLNNSQVEILIEQNNPGIIVYDMLDNIGGTGDADRTDLKLESMYQWARERSVKYSSVGLATTQISNEGHNLRFPGLSMLKDSKTGKQGACDFQIMIGSIEDPNFKMARFIGLPKNKIRRSAGPSDPRVEVIFDSLRSRYVDIQTDPTTGV